MKLKEQNNMIHTLIIMIINNNKDRNIMIIINKLINSNILKISNNNIKNNIKNSKIMQKRFDNFILIFENLN